MSSADVSAPLTTSSLHEIIGDLDKPELLYTLDPDGRSIVLKPGVDFHLDAGSVFELDGDIQASGAGSILLNGRVSVAADIRLVANNGRIVLGETTAKANGLSLALIAGSDGIRLAGPIDLWDGDLILESQGTVTQDGAIRARGLALLGDNADYALTHSGNAVLVLAGDARSIHFEQTGSLAIDQVGTTAGLTAAENVLVRAKGADSVLTLNDAVTARGNGYALVLATDGRIVNRAGAHPFQAPNGWYLVYSADHEQNDLGDFKSPGNLFGRTYDTDRPGDLDLEFGGALGDRMVYASQPTLVVQIDDTSRLYFSDNPAFTFSVVSGVVDDDDPDEVLQAGTLRTDADKASGVGDYAITVDDPFTSSFGYQVQVIDGTLKITQLPITVRADSVSKVYGDADPALTYTAIAGDLLGSDVLSGSLTRDSGEELGSYVIRQGSLGNPNYEITFVPGTLTIRTGTASFPDAYRSALEILRRLQRTSLFEDFGFGVVLDAAPDSSD